MTNDQTELMMGVRESYEWLLCWLEDAVSNRPDVDRMNRQIQLNMQMMDRAMEAPAVAGAAAVGAATTACRLLRLIADNAPDLAVQFVHDMRNDIDNAGSAG